MSDLAGDPTPLLEALARLPAANLHGDLKLANVALVDEDRVGFIDWQMTLRAPVAVELAWFLVSNVAILPEDPDAILDRYRDTIGLRGLPGVGRPNGGAGRVLGDWDAQGDLTWIVGLLLRGWRKGLDAEAGVATGWGATASDDLAWWCRRAVEASDRRL